MNIKALQRRLSAFHVLRKPADGDGDDLGGEVIDATNPDAGDAPGADEDRGDNFTPTSEEAPAPAPAATAEDEPDEATGGKPAAGIPKARFNEVNEARKEAEARAEALQRELDALKMQPATAPAPTTAAPAAPAAPEFDVDAADIEKAMMLGTDLYESGLRLGPIGLLGSEPFTREDGADGEGIRVKFSTHYTEKYGDPYATASQQ